MSAETAPPSIRAYRVRCPACGAEPHRACNGIDQRLVHEARAKAAKR